MLSPDQSEQFKKDTLYQFDAVFDPSCPSSSLSSSLLPLIPRLALGYNCTIFAYGPTGSGKSFTMFGEGGEEGRREEGGGKREDGGGRREDGGAGREEVGRRRGGREEIGREEGRVGGIIPHLLFELLRNSHLSIKFSYLEIYNEHIHDLLVPDSPNLMIFEDPAKGFFVADLSQFSITSIEELTTLITDGNYRRVMASTSANAFSSRSHAILQFYIENSNPLLLPPSPLPPPSSLPPLISILPSSSLEKENPEHTFTSCSSSPSSSYPTPPSLLPTSSCSPPSSFLPPPPQLPLSLQKLTTLSKLNLIDLAGSERASVNTNRGLRMTEGANINRSLLALATCINILSDPSKKGAFVPYRDSKLTRLLKDSLGGNTLTVMVACISPATGSWEETANTIKYASRAMRIVGKVSRNVKEERGCGEYDQIIGELKKEIETLKVCEFIIMNFLM